MQFGIHQLMEPVRYTGHLVNIDKNTVLVIVEQLGWDFRYCQENTMIAREKEELSRCVGAVDCRRAICLYLEIL